MDRCFVIQEFDKGTFDKRFRDVFAPAIRDAGFDPYRVDHDPQVEIPIEEIAKAIRESLTCLADITTNNPNVWFEVGYAIASGKNVCLICSSERDEPFPFDVQHRAIISYETASSSDFDSLRAKIAKRLKAIRTKIKTTSEIQMRDTCSVEGLGAHEINALAVIMANRSIYPGGLPAMRVREEMASYGFTDVAAELATAGLQGHGLIEGFEIDDQHEPRYVAFKVTGPGVRWLIDHQDELNLVTPDSASHTTSEHQPVDPDDIPF